MDEPSSDRIKCAAAMSTDPDTAKAIREACEEASAQLGGEPNLVLAFYTHHHDVDSIAKAFHDRYPKCPRLGCCGESIVGRNREIEHAPALSIWMATLPGVALVPFHLDFSAEIDQGSFVGWTQELLQSWPDNSLLLLFGEPFSFPADRFVALLNEEQPGVPVVGGMASGGDRPGSHRLFLNDEVIDRGAIGIRLHGQVQTRTIVSQGCRPIGQSCVITKADRNVIFELGGRPPLELLQELFSQLSHEDQEKAQRGLHLGRVINEYQDNFSRGDFLVRNVIGVDRKEGAIAIGDYVRAGQTVQFQIRDAESADEDLRHLMAEASNASGPAGALLFTCNGRGSRLFGSADHDARAVTEALQDAPLAGFFAAGELGPIGGKNFLHGFTASIVTFHESKDAS